jgi:hypothetical protein
VISGRTLCVEDSWFAFTSGEPDGLPHALHELTDEKWLGVGEGFIAVGSGGDSFYPMITFETWSYEPPRTPLPANGYELEVQAEFEGPSLTLITTGDNASPSYELPPDMGNGLNFRFRVIRDPDGDHEFDDTLETWLIQVWAVD